MADAKLSTKFLFSHPANFISCGFGSGLFPIAPGTAGTLFGWASYIAIRPFFADWAFVALLVASFAIGIWAIDKSGVACGEVDHGSFVWDEIVPFWGLLFLIPNDPLWQAGAFVLFRIFDITKPQPAKYFDTKVKNGFGVMMDDVVAALYSLGVIALALYFLQK